MKIAMIVAQGQNRVIGVDGDLPWRIPADLKFFKQTTLGKPIVMGRKTFDSLGRALPGRLNIVITRDANYQAEGAAVVSSIDDALTLAKKEAAEKQLAEIMVIGGAQIYQQALPLADRLYLTKVALAPEGDAYFPELNADEWRLEWEENHDAEEGIPAFTFQRYEHI